jgi:hypothetical protein
MCLDEETGAIRAPSSSCPSLASPFLFAPLSLNPRRLLSPHPTTPANLRGVSALHKATSSLFPAARTFTRRVIPLFDRGPVEIYVAHCSPRF